MTPEDSVKQWNSLHKSGTPVVILFSDGRLADRRIKGTTDGEATVINGVACIQIEDVIGYYPLNRIMVDLWQRNIS